MSQIKIFEKKILERYPQLLEILLEDHTTHDNIIWATNNYEHRGTSYSFANQITIEQITGDNKDVILPRIKKDQLLQKSRVRDKAEVFTPSWLCNFQNNLVDNAWFEREDVFNTLIMNEKRWVTNKEPIEFSKQKTWQSYVRSRILEITCGEAPYLVSRYDTTTGMFIEVKDRIGLLDRKLRVINENVHELKEWLHMTKEAYQYTYGYEWQGDSLLIARQSLLFTFIENHILKFDKEPTIDAITNIAEIISWNIWQMDGLKFVIPNSCKETTQAKADLFGDTVITIPCKGCTNKSKFEHNGIYCIVKDWSIEDSTTQEEGKNYRFVDLLKKDAK